LVFCLPFDEAFALARKKQCSCPIDAGTYARRTICRAFAGYTLAVIGRLDDRAIQCSVTPVIEPRSRSVLDAPLSRGITAVL
jgi:hypothetical protein